MPLTRLDFGCIIKKNSECGDKIPVVGEFADAAKLYRTGDNLIDAAKVADNAIDAAKSGEVVGSIKKQMPDLPKSYQDLEIDGWVETTHSGMAKNTSSKSYTKDGWEVRFDKGDTSTSGYGSRYHYHVLNPNSTGKHDYYLDKNGNPVPKNSKASHIIVE